MGAFAIHLTCVMTDSFEDLCQFRLYKITALGKLAIYNLKTVLALPFTHFRNGQKRKNTSSEFKQEEKTNLSFEEFRER